MKNKIQNFWDFWGPLLITFGLYAGIRFYIGEARYIPSGSMLPGLKINDRLIVEKISLRSRPPKRGEVVVFNSPHSFDPVLLAMRRKKLPSSIECSLVTFPLISFIPGLNDPSCDAYIKRVVAIAGDEVQVNAKGKVFIKGKLIDEPYIKSFCLISKSGKTSCRSIQDIVPKGHVLVLGDNRRNSWDGRFWPGGAFLPESEILGRAIWRFWPIHRIGAISS